jgi:hypothetical protein
MTTVLPSETCSALKMVPIAPVPTTSSKRKLLPMILPIIGSAGSCRTAAAFRVPQCGQNFRPGETGREHVEQGVNASVFRTGEG